MILLYPPSHHSWNSFNRYHFSIYIHVHTVFVPYLPSYTFSLHPVCPPPYRTYSAFLFSNFVKEKEWRLFMTVTQGFSLWYFHEYMFYNLNWFISSIFLLSTLVPFLWWFQQV
jgi:hypothetical protein